MHSLPRIAGDDDDHVVFAKIAHQGFDLQGRDRPVRTAAHPCRILFTNNKVLD